MKPSEQLGIRRAHMEVQWRKMTFS